MRLSLALTGLALAVLAACDPISEEQCRAGNWTGLGLRDGSDGRPASRFDDYVEICSQLGITADRTAYMAARSEGLKTFCVPERAYQEGLDGRRIGAVCSPDIMPRLFDLNSRGRKVHDAEETIERAGDSIDDAESRIFSLLSVDSDEARSEIAELRARIRERRRDIFWAKRDIRRYSVYF